MSDSFYSFLVFLVSYNPMKSAFLFLLCFFLCGILADTVLSCEEKGFSSSLLCSSCDKLSAFVGNSGRVRHMECVTHRNCEGVPRMLSR